MEAITLLTEARMLSAVKGGCSGAAVVLVVAPESADMNDLSMSRRTRSIRSCEMVTSSLPLIDIALEPFPYRLYPT